MLIIERQTGFTFKCLPAVFIIAGLDLELSMLATVNK